MAHLDFLKHHAGSTRSCLKRHTFAINVVINTVLGLLCFASYVFLLTLYLSKGLRARSFTYVNEGTVSPSNAISFCGAILTGATSALLSRCVEHNLWSIILGSPPVMRSTGRLTPKESYQDAQWIVSPFARLAYIFRGRSWVLCISGLFLFCTAVSSPVLLHGVKPVGVDQLRYESIEPTRPSFAGFTDGYNPFIPDCKYGKQYQKWVRPDDGVPASMIMASLASMNNMSVPPANFCSSDSCRAVVYATALQAECNFALQIFSNADTYWREYLGNSNKIRCSNFSNRTCLSLTKETMANFTSGPSAGCIQNHEKLVPEFDCPAGDFAVVFGTWISEGSESTKPSVRMHTVDCPVSFGNVTILQDGQAPPSLDRTSFAKSAATLPKKETITKHFQNDTTWSSLASTAVWRWHNTYVGLQEDHDRSASPYTFAFGGPDGRMEPFSRYLLVRPNATDGFMEDTALVAKAIENNFDAATLFAFQKVPEAASVDITYTDHVVLWSYDPRVLSILIPPLIATVLVLGTRWRVHSDDVVIGYNPIAIARRAEEILAPLSTTSANPGKEPGWKPDHTRGDYVTIPRDEISLATLDFSERRGSSSTLRPVVSEETIANEQAGPSEETNSIE